MRMLRYLSPVLMLSSNLMAAEMPKLGGLFKGELVKNDNKTMEASDTKSGSLSSLSQRAFLDMTVAGSLSETVKFDSQVTFINGGEGANFCQGTPVKKANGTWWANSAFSVTIGCSKDRVGGWDFANYEEAATIRPALPMKISYGPNSSMYNPAIDLSLHMFGDLTLRLQDDVEADNNNTTRWNASGEEQQTWGIEWTGEFAGIKPILQYASFDAGHSSTFDVGFSVMASGLNLTFDWMSLNKGNKVASDDGLKSKNKVDKSTRMSLEATYALPMVTPYLYWSNFKNKLWEKDPGANSKQGTWDHEGQVISLGVMANNVSANFTPYLAVDMQGGKFANNAADATAKASKTDLVVRLGATGHF